MSAALTGRSYQLHLFPLSFREFVAYKLGYNLQPHDILKRNIKITVKKLFRNYVLNGGFPEVVLQDFRPLLQEYLRNIIYRDIVLRYRIKHEASLREIVSFVISNIGVPLSLEKISTMTKIKNIMTLKNYLSYLEDSFLFFAAMKHSYSIKKQIYNPDKIYVCDSGIYNEVAFVSSANAGRLLEDVVFIELKRRYKDVYYFSKKKECDFVIQIKNKVMQAVQVTKDWGAGNKEREIEGLLEALEEYDLRDGLILTEDDTDEIHVSGRKIVIQPIWQWCLTFT